jgi:Protein O-mannosyl-transferase TMEM260-like
VSEDGAAKTGETRDALTAALLFLVLAAIFALTRSRWLDDWDSVNFALALDDFDLPKHQPHPPGYPVYVAAGKLVHLVVAGHAGALTLVSSLSGAAAAAMFFLLLRRFVDWAVAMVATIAMALSPLFWLQSGLALTDMFAMLFVVAFLLVEGYPASTPQGDRLRLIACGVIAGLSLGARPHVTLVIVAYWCVRALWSRSFSWTRLLTAVLSFLAGELAWLAPAAVATGGFDTYVSACLAQFQYRLDRPAVSVLGASVSLSYLAARAAALISWLGQNFAPLHITKSRQAALGLFVLAPYVYFAWRSPAKPVARPYLIASGLYLLMLFVLLPTQHQRYFLPFTLIAGFAVAGVLVLFRRPVVQAVATAVLLALSVVPSLFLIGGLAKPPPVAAIEWIKSTHPNAIVFSESLSRHLTFYWPEADARPQPETEADCAAFSKDLASGRLLLSTRPNLCGAEGSKVAAFRRDRRVHDKHHQITLFAFGRPATR